MHSARDGTKKHRVMAPDEGVWFFCGEDEVILEAMKRAGCGPFHYGCFGGGCGFCKMKIERGDYAVVKKMSCAHISEQEKDTGVVLICCVKPRGDLTIVRA